MNVLEKNNFAKMMMVVCELYGKRISKSLLSLYWTALERFSFEDIRSALTHHLNNPDVGQFMPKPADIMRYLNGDSETNALQAWAKVESAIRKVGSYVSIGFDDPVIHVVIVEMGGWPKLCSTLAAEMPFRANEFMKRYRSIQQKTSMCFPKYLPGILEQTNQTQGYHDEDFVPVLIGDEKLALDVIAAGNDTPSIEIHHENHLARDFFKRNAQPLFLQKKQQEGNTHGEEDE